MTDKKTHNSRRVFIKTVGAIGTGSMLASLVPMVDAADKNSSKKTDLQTLPTRPFGKTGVNVSILSLGGVLGMSDLLEIASQSAMCCAAPCTITGMEIGRRRWRCSMRYRQIREQILKKQIIQQQKKIVLKKYKLAKL